MTIIDFLITAFVIILVTYIIILIGQNIGQMFDDKKDDTVDFEDECNYKVKDSDEVLDIEYKILKCEDPIFSCEDVKKYIEERIYGFKHNNGYVLNHRLPFKLYVWSHGKSENELRLRASSDNNKIVFELRIKLDNADKYHISHKREYDLINISFMDDLYYVHTNFKEIK